ncbi:MAG: succinate--CoA ligase subunit alpha [Hyphomicrobiales bacterium]|nr:succinate--CoA ligase subunit alpha [Hyphomicrobiales bacterium]
MAILVGAQTKAICQGLTGRIGSYYAERAIAYGTNLVAGVRPGKGGTRHLDRPIFDTVAEAMAETGGNASLVFVPPANAADAIVEAIEAEMPLVVCVTERVPVLDMVRVKDALKGTETKLVGPNSQGVLSPGLSKLGVMSTVHERQGRIGIVSRSATLTSEIVAQTSAAGLGQSTTVGIGGDPVHGIGFVDCLELFMKDPGTDGIILIGEIGGSEEVLAADYLKSSGASKPVVALIAGRHAPQEQRMGHAGTITMFGRGDAETKIAALREAGAHIAPNATRVAATMQGALQ